MWSRRGRAAGAVVAGAGLVLAAAHAAPAAPAGRVRTYRVSRIGPGAAALRLDVVSTLRGPEAVSLVVVVPLSGERTVRYSSLRQAGVPEPMVYAEGTYAFRGCSSPCAGTGAAEPYTHSLDLPPLRADVLIAVRDGTAKITASAGWKAREVAPLGLRTVGGDQTPATGATVQGVTVERFARASAVGGRYGSYVAATLPCQAGGSGTATLAPAPLRHGDPRFTLFCGPLGAAGGSAVASTNHAATWTLKGEATGAGYSRTRLLVLDYPVA